MSRRLYSGLNVLHHCYLLKTYLLNILIIMKIETDAGRFNLFYNKNTDLLNTPIRLLKKISELESDSKD